MNKLNQRPSLYTYKIIENILFIKKHIHNWEAYKTLRRKERKLVKVFRYDTVRIYNVNMSDNKIKERKEYSKLKSKDFFIYYYDYGYEGFKKITKISEFYNKAHVQIVEVLR